MDNSLAAVYIIRSVILCLLPLPLPPYVLAEIIVAVFGKDVEAALLYCNTKGLHLRPAQLEKHRTGGSKTGLVPLILDIKRMSTSVTNKKGTKQSKLARR